MDEAPGQIPLATPVLVPDIITIMAQKFFDSVISDSGVEPYTALALSNIAVKMAETTYLMGMQDGRRQPDIRESLNNILQA